VLRALAVAFPVTVASTRYSLARWGKQVAEEGNIALPRTGKEGWVPHSSATLA
jgi:hypothetical protein